MGLWACHCKVGLGHYDPSVPLLSKPICPEHVPKKATEPGLPTITGPLNQLFRHAKSSEGHQQGGSYTHTAGNVVAHIHIFRDVVAAHTHINTPPRDVAAAAHTQTTDTYSCDNTHTHTHRALTSIYPDAALKTLFGVMQLKNQNSCCILFSIHIRSVLHGSMRNA